MFVIDNIANMIKSAFDFFATNKEHQLETRNIKEDNRQDKALKAANIALDAVSKEVGYLSDETADIFRKQKKIFDKNIL